MAVSKKVYQRHLSSLDKSAEFALGVKAYMRKHRIPKEQYAEAAAEYAEALEFEGSNLPFAAQFGEDPDADKNTSKSYTSELGKKYTRQEADIFLSELVERRVSAGEDRKTATEEIFSDPDLAHLVDIYNS